MQNSLLRGAPMHIVERMIPLDEWYRAQGYDDQSRDAAIYYLAVERSIAPTGWTYALPQDGRYDPNSELPYEDWEEDIPLEPEAVKWALNSLQNPANKLLLGFNRLKKSPDDHGKTAVEEIGSLATGLFASYNALSPQEKRRFQFLGTYNASGLGDVIILSLHEQLRERQLIADTFDTAVIPTINIVPPVTVGESIYNLSISDLGTISYFSNVTQMIPLKQGVDDQEMFNRISFYLLSILARETAFKLDSTYNFDGAWFKKDVIENISVLRPYPELVVLLVHFSQKLKRRPNVAYSLVPTLGPIDQEKTKKLGTLIANNWSGVIWTRLHLWIDHAEINLQPRNLTFDNMVAVYSVGATWYKFTPDLQTYLYPKQADVVNQFWNTYGQSIEMLQKLALFYQQWLVLYNREISKDNALLQLRSRGVCEQFVGQLADRRTLERLRQPLWELEQTALSYGDVPLRFLLNHERPILSGQGISALRQYQSDIRTYSLHGLRSSLWWFDVLRAWWNHVCQDVLEERLEQIIQRSDSSDEDSLEMEIEKISQQEKIDDVVATALIAFAQKTGFFKKRRAGLDAIRKARMSKSMRQEAERRFKLISENSNAIFELDRLDRQIRAGQLPVQYAQTEIEDLINRYK